MSDYADNIVKPLRRRLVLEFLEGQKDYVSNADLLLHWINDTRDGVTAYYSDVVEDLAWLEARGFVKLDGQDFLVVEVTARGLRVARDQATDEGVARPRPRS